MKRIHLLLYTLTLLALISCSPENNFDKVYSGISSTDYRQFLARIASDDFQGRKPFTAGEDSTIRYLKNEFMQMGLKPGNGDSYFQEVPMVAITGTPSPVMKIKGGKRDIDLNYWTDYVGTTLRVTDKVDLVNSPMIFAGYGIVAPEYNWNDYKNLDVRDKTVVVLVNDPGYGSGDSTFFKGKAMTYYGRWTYKYEEAARQGAAAVLIIHDTAPASYPWEVVQNGWSGTQLHLETKDNNMSRCALEGWISLDAAKKLFANAGLDNYDFFAEARKRDFKARSLNQVMSVQLQNKISHSVSHNVLAVIPGSKRPDEVVIYTAHWDHFGIGVPVNGDSIYNGAVDNGSGTAALLELAGSFMKLDVKPERTILFMAVTGEEQGLLGSEYYCSHPVYPPSKTVADLNMDAFNDYGRTKDFMVVGYGQSELEDYARKAAKKQGRYIIPDAKPEAGGFFRSDHFSFAHIGVPALYGKGGIDSEELGKEWGLKQMKAYTANRYHKPADNYAPDMNVDGMVQDIQLFFDVGHTLSMESTFPQWKEGSEFRAIREKEMNK